MDPCRIYNTNIKIRNDKSEWSYISLQPEYVSTSLVNY